MQFKVEFGSQNLNLLEGFYNRSLIQMKGTFNNSLALPVHVENISSIIYRIHPRTY